MSKPKPPGRACNPVPRARRDDATISVNGVKRRRNGAAFRQVGGTRRAIPAEARRTRGFRFPCDPATPAQEKMLATMIRNYLRLDFVSKNPHVPAETIADVLTISERAAYTLVADVRRSSCGPAVELVLDVLHGMMAGKIAGVLGTRKTGTNKWLFGLVNYYGPESTDVRSRLVRFNPDHSRRYREALEKLSQWRRAVEAHPGGFRGYFDGARPLEMECQTSDDLDIFHRLHAAFQLDYREWLGRS